MTSGSADATLDLLALTEQLCAIDSVSGNERAIADFVEHWLRTHAGSLAIERVEQNVVARTTGSAGARVVLGGHLDTVPPAGNAEPRRDGDVVHGLGTADMKGGLAVLLVLAARAARCRPEREATFVFYEGEEVAEDRNGLRALFAARPDLVAGDLAVLLEPTSGWLEAGCQGTIHVRATFRGARAHSARPWTGVNAVHRAAPLLARVASYESPSVTVDGLPYRESLQVVRVDGGVAHNVIPDVCTVVVNRRYAPSRATDDAVAELVELCEDAGADEVEVLNASPAAPPALRDPLVAELAGRFDLGVRPKLGWTDVARFAAAGVPACNLGPGDPELAHTPGERVAAADLAGCEQVLAAFLGLSGPPSRG